MPNSQINTYNGSRYPGVPATLLDMCVEFSLLNALDSPKSAIFATKSPFSLDILTL